MTTAGRGQRADQRTVWSRGIGIVRRLSLGGRLGAGLLLGVVLLATIGPYVAPYSPTAVSVGVPLEGPSVAHLLGTDSLGRDVLSRFLHGGRSMMLLPAAATLVAVGTGTVLGLWTGYVGGMADQLLMRLVDLLMSIPPLLLVMVFVIVLGSSPFTIVMLVGAFFAPRIVRVVRGATQGVRSEDYVTAATARGESTPGILWHEILPNLTGPLLAESAMRLAHTVIFISTLNFLGLGVQPPSPDWGLMVSEGRTVIGIAPSVALVPAAAIAALAIGVNLLADDAAAKLTRRETTEVVL